MIRTATGRQRPVADDYLHESLNVFRTNLRLIREAARIMGAELFVAKQATMITAGSPPRVLNPWYIVRHEFDYDAHVRAFDDIYRVIDEEIRPDRIIDATVLSGTRRYFRDHIHYVRAGAEALSSVMAEGLSAYLSEQVGSRRRPAAASPL